MASVSAAHVSVLEVPALSQGLENSRPASKPSLDGSVLVSAIHVLVLVSEYSEYSFFFYLQFLNINICTKHAYVVHFLKSGLLFLYVV